MTDTQATGPSSAEPTEGKKRTPKIKKAEAATNGEGTATNEEKVSRPRLPRVPEEYVVTVLKPGSKSTTAAERFNVYRTGMTIKEYLDIMTNEPWSRSAASTWADIRWDMDPVRAFINVGPTTVDIPPPPPPKEKKPKKAKKAAEAEAGGAESGTQPAA
jgi:hypothetical protein